jgi:hypothetical protein
MDLTEMGIKVQSPYLENKKPIQCFAKNGEYLQLNRLRANLPLQLLLPLIRSLYY